MTLPVVPDDLDRPATRRDVLHALDVLREMHDFASEPSHAADLTWQVLTTEWRQEARAKHTAEEGK